MRSFIIKITLALLIIGCKSREISSSSTDNIVTQKAGSSIAQKAPKLSAVHVNSRGVALDTDADGIPDYKDKELLTPQNCFPVDSTGVGNCPVLPCCNDSIN